MAGIAVNLYALGVVVAVVIVWVITHRRRMARMPEHIVPVGELDPDQIHVPSIYVKRVVQSAGLNKWIERRTVRKAN